MCPIRTVVRDATEKELAESRERLDKRKSPEQRKSEKEKV